MQVAVLYTSAGLLIAIIGLLLLRAVIAAFTWVVAGKTVWVLPNVLAEVRKCCDWACWQQIQQCVLHHMQNEA